MQELDDDSKIVGGFYKHLIEASDEEVDSLLKSFKKAELINLIKTNILIIKQLIKMNQDMKSVVDQSQSFVMCPPNLDIN